MKWQTWEPPSEADKEERTDSAQTHREQVDRWSQVVEDNRRNAEEAERREQEQRSRRR